jgi:hypothetical protein
MPNALHKPRASVTVAEFLARPGDGTGRKCQLIDGEVRVMAPGSAAHAIIIQANLTYEDETRSFECIGFACPLLDIHAETSFGKEDLA